MKELLYKLLNHECLTREEMKRELPDAGERMRHYEKELEEWKD